MPYLRLLLAWTLMVALPLQGLAAASMLFCGPDVTHRVHAAEHGHSADAASHDHAQHQPAVDADLGVDNATAHAGDGTAVDPLHKCGACAACSHAVAIAQHPQVLSPDRPTRAEPGEPLVAMHSRPARVPDKPPRA